MASSMIEANPCLHNLKYFKTFGETWWLTTKHQLDCLIMSLHDKEQRRGLQIFPLCYSESLISQTCMSLECWRKLDYLERTQVDNGFESRTFFLGGKSTNHCTTMLLPSLPNHMNYPNKKRAKHETSSHTLRRLLLWFGAV